VCLTLRLHLLGVRKCYPVTCKRRRRREDAGLLSTLWFTCAVDCLCLELIVKLSFYQWSLLISVSLIWQSKPVLAYFLSPVSIWYILPYIKVCWGMSLELSESVLAHRDFLFSHNHSRLYCLHNYLWQFLNCWLHSCLTFWNIA
jgi:hypothetical protein